MGVALELMMDLGWTECGDSVIDVGEECDDDGFVPGDGCSEICRIEDCYVCAGEPSVCSPDDLATTARVQNALGILKWQTGDLDGASALYERSRSAYDEVGNLEGVAGAFNNLGILRWQQGDTEGALSLYAEALRLSEDLGDRRTVAILYNNIGEAYRRKGDDTNARKFYERSLQVSESLGFLWQMGEVHRNLGQLLAGREAVNHLNHAASIFESLGARRDSDEVAGLISQLPSGPSTAESNKED